MRKGESFDVPCPTIIDWATHLKVLEKRQANKTYPARNPKSDFLAGRLLYCECGRRWASRTSRHRGKRKHERSVAGVYCCPERHPEFIHPNCPRTVGSNKADDLLWRKVSDVIANPEALLMGAREHVESLRSQIDDLLADKSRLEQGLGEIAQQRQWVIRQARKGSITEQDMDEQLAELSAQEVILRGDLVAKENGIELVDLDDWEEQVDMTMDALRQQIKLLATEPQTAEDRRKQFDLKRQIVQLLVDRVLITNDRDLRVSFRVDLSSVLGSTQLHDQNKQVGICSRRQSCRPRRACGGGA
jgi:hypothetical protein